MASMTKNNHQDADCTRPGPHDIPKRGGLSRDVEPLCGLRPRPSSFDLDDGES